MQVLQGGDEAVTALLKTQLLVQSFLRIAFGSAQGRATSGNNRQMCLSFKCTQRPELIAAGWSSHPSEV